MSDCWFNLPNDETAAELEVTIPVKGRVKMPASVIQEVDQFRDLLNQSMEKQKWVMHGTLPEMLQSCLSGYERVASDALHGAESVRDDMLVMLRAVSLTMQAVICDHLNHGQKNERIRGILSLVEMNIQSLRQERFDFHGSTWQRAPDLFLWKERERDLREKIDRLERELLEARTELEDGENVEPDFSDC